MKLCILFNQLSILIIKTSDKGNIINIFLFTVSKFNKFHKKESVFIELNPKIRNKDGGVFSCQNTQKNLK